MYLGGPEYDEEEEDISPDLWQEACWIVIRWVLIGTIADLLCKTSKLISSTVYDYIVLMRNVAYLEGRVNKRSKA